RKGRVLDALTDSVAALRRRMTPEDRALLDRLSAITALESTLALRGPGAMPQEEHRARMARLDEERQQLEAEASRRSRDLRAALEPVTLEQVRAALPEGAALVELFQY